MTGARSMKDRVAVVTGGASGIGQAIVLAMADEGVTVHALTRGAIPAIRVRNGASISWHHVDLMDDRAISEFVARLRCTERGLDYLIHSAGQFQSGPVTETPIETLDDAWRVNARAPFLLTQLLVPSLIRSKGFIGFINSSVWLNPRRELSAYTMSKYALKALADSLRAELNSHDVRVVSIYPGRTATPMQQTIHDARAAFYRPDVLLQPESIATALMSAFAMPPSCEVTDIYLRPSNAAPANFQE